MKKILAWPAPLLQKWLLSLLLCLPFLTAAIVSAFSGDRTFLILSALLLLFCGIRCAELYVLLANERYRAEDGVCLAVSSIPFQHQRRVTLQRADGNHIVFCVEKNKRLSVGQTYRVYLPTGTVVSEVKKAHLPQHYALTVEKIEIDSICIVPDASEKPVEKSQQKPYN
ncbi:MAG: hypothetical protein ACLR5X_12570 [Oscillospiraceae bacterium]|nr:hypothetical protein [Clostridiales bacterium]